jgi:hypothetical protein
MKPADLRLTREKALSEKQIQDEACDFNERYFAAYHLQCLAQTHPEVISTETLSALQGPLKDPGLSHQRRGFFLCRLAADTLASIIVHADRRSLADRAFASLKEVLLTSAGHAHRVTAEALGGLPFSIRGPELEEVRTQQIPSASWPDILHQKGFRLSASPVFVGRSLVAPLKDRDQLLVFKLLPENGFPISLFNEALWTQELRQGKYIFPVRFDIPEGIEIGGHYVFRLKDIPVRLPESMDNCACPFATAFIAHRDYFSYPDRVDPAGNQSAFSRLMFRNAWLLGRLTSWGIVHSAPIPLFHNRVQRHRRRDHGRYEWFRGGRLDRWLASCAYPNIGLTGVRDFEHFISFKGESRDLYRHIGCHMLSFLLVAGSSFRRRDASQVGFDEDGKPVDVRNLFDRAVLKKTIQGIFLFYYRGFVQRELSGSIPVDLDNLVSKMIEEMGVDRHMEEMLRAADQKAMSDEEFRTFLKQRGYADEAINGIDKGERDIVIHTGPHLGAFNERISLPELIECVETMSALCIAGKFWQRHFTSSRSKTFGARKEKIHARYQTLQDRGRGPFGSAFGEAGAV